MAAIVAARIAAALSAPVGKRPPAWLQQDRTRPFTPTLKVAIFSTPAGASCETVPVCAAPGASSRTMKAPDQSRNPEQGHGPRFVRSAPAIKQARRRRSIHEVQLEVRLEHTRSLETRQHVRE